MGDAEKLYTIPHVLSEVSNLTDLSGEEAFAARHSVTAGGAAPAQFAGRGEHVLYTTGIDRRGDRFSG